MQMELMELMESEKEQDLLRIKQAGGELMKQKEGTSTANRELIGVGGELIKQKSRN